MAHDLWHLLLRFIGRKSENHRKATQHIHDASFSSFCDKTSGTKKVNLLSISPSRGRASIMHAHFQLCKYQ